jgi:hypothetical protein
MPLSHPAVSMLAVGEKATEFTERSRVVADSLSLDPPMRFG